MKIHVLIVAGGSGSRMKSDVPKQFMLLNNKPVLMHTIEKFSSFSPEVNLTLVLPETQFEVWKDLCQTYHFDVPHQLVAGGTERFWSVKNGLEVISDNGIVFIHDGVRPLVSHATIKICLETALVTGNAVPVMPVVESLRQIKFGHNRTVSRKHFVTIQTPQVFRTSDIKAAYQQAFDPAFTDDASVLERTGKEIHLVEGNPENIKITHPFDLKVAELMLHSSGFRHEF
ncbi:MAG: 2-C-methyl-D-erythritol 4-phosphate cytidylyltransferase [Prolixibacteraceae bacterium]|nr:2-C-methyl-D-erythritol 4-phosphate cytidylyltransferase [Prolixibacteraceae bacterium]